ncbi:MAG: hypothetical protein ACTSP0_00705 [Alphaproteobacteria bacterium]
MRTTAAGRITSLFTTLALLLALAISLAGCAGGALTSAFSGSGGNSGSSKLDPISFAQIIGPPATISNQLTGQLISAARQKNIPVITEKGKPAKFTVRGYLAQSNERKGEKITYIWDVTDKSGKRVHRILGEEIVPVKQGAKPWTSVNQAAMQKIAAKTANDLALWLPKQKAGAGTAASATPVKSPPTRTASTQASRKPAPTTRPAPAKTARSGPIVALVPPVSGAPGDGRSTLTNALRRRLRVKGVRIASTGGVNVFKINGKVTIGKVSSTTQKVKIVWQLLDPKGKDLGSVTQQTDVPKGSLDKKWGPAATSAGNAAANEILKLIAKSRG